MKERYLGKLSAGMQGFSPAEEVTVEDVELNCALGTGYAPSYVSVSQGIEDMRTTKSS